MHNKTVCVCVSVSGLHLPVNMDQWRALVNKLPSRLINTEFLNSQRNYWLSLHSPGIFKYTFQVQHS